MLGPLSWVVISMNRKLTFAVLSAVALTAVAGGYVSLMHGSATANTSPAVKKDVALKNVSEHVLPGGASSLNETYQDWRLICQQTATASRCAISQQEFDGKTHQRIVSIELTSSANQMSGVVVLPFGLALNKGAELHADGKTLGNILNFSTCVPAGCLVPVSFDHTQLDTLQMAKKVEVKFSTLTGQQITLPISNKGLDKAVNRLAALSH